MLGNMTMSLVPTYGWVFPLASVENISLGKPIGSAGGGRARADRGAPPPPNEMMPAIGLVLSELCHEFRRRLGHRGNRAAAIVFRPTQSDDFRRCRDFLRRPDITYGQLVVTMTDITQLTTYAGLFDLGNQ